MKPLFLTRRLIAVTATALLFVTGICARATIYNWTNTASGGWSTAANWVPNNVPGATDTAIITNAGVTVSLTSSTTVGSIILGTNGPGTVTLSISGETLVVNGQLTVNPSGSFTVDSGALAGNAIITGTVKWTGGIFGLGNYAMTIATNGTVILAGISGTSYVMSEYITNAGTLRLQGGDLSISYCGGSGYGGLYNLPGALVDMTADSSISTPCNGPGFINAGTLRKSGGTGTNAITATPFTSTGTVDAQTGTISLNGGGGSGLFAAEPGATLAFNSGTFTLTGNVISSNAVLAGGALSGNFNLSGKLNWTGGIFGAGNNSLTIASNALLVLAGATGSNYLMQEAVTNAGTVRVQSGNLQIDNCGGGQYGQFINLPGALVDMTADVSFNDDGCGPGILNAGVVKKSGGTGTNYINGVFVNLGTVDAQTGTISFNGADNGGGVFAAETGAALAFSSGMLTLNGDLVSSNATLAGATLAGNGTINGKLNWTGGMFGAGNNSLTIASNALLVLAGANGSNYLMQQVVTNAGTVRVQSGNIQINWCGGGQYGQFINLPGALVDMTADVSFNDDGCGPGILNAGVVKKSGGTGTNYINGVFVNLGTVDAQTGTISFNGADNGGGVFAAETGAALAFSSGMLTLNGDLVSSNATLAGATLAGNGTINGKLNWTGGMFGAGNNSLTIASNALLVLAGANGSNYLMQQVVTNAGTVRVQSGNIQINWCGGGQYGQFINLPGALVDMTADVSFNDDGCGPGILNAGVVKKSGGTGTNYINGVFVNLGTVDAQTGTISINGNYSIAGGTLNFGISSLANYGVISFGGPVALAGNLSANFNNGYLPAIGSQFKVLLSTGLSGSFSGVNVPAGISVVYTNNSVYLDVTGLVPVQILNTHTIGSNLVFQFPTTSGQSYTLQQNNDLTTTNWIFYTNIIGNGLLYQFITPVTNTPQDFFRVRQP